MPSAPKGPGANPKATPTTGRSTTRGSTPGGGTPRDPEPEATAKAMPRRSTSGGSPGKRSDNSWINKEDTGGTAEPQRREPSRGPATRAADNSWIRQTEETRGRQVVENPEPDRREHRRRDPERGDRQYRRDGHKGRSWEEGNPAWRALNKQDYKFLKRALDFRLDKWTRLENIGYMLGQTLRHLKTHNWQRVKLDSTSYMDVAAILNLEV